MQSTGKLVVIASLLTIFGAGNIHAADVLVSSPLPVQAPSTSTIKLKVSGWLNRAILFADNGEDNDVFYVDNDNTASRFRFVATGQLNDDIKAGATIELQFESNSTFDIGFNSNGGTGGTNLGGGAFGVGERIAEVWFKSNTLGKLSLGQGNTASFGTSAVDLSGTKLAATSRVDAIAGGLTFAGTAIRVRGAYPSLNGGIRRDRIRYDAPAFAGIRASTSASQGGRWDAALRYSRQFSYAQVAAAAAFQNANSVGASKQFNGSISMRLDNGFNVTAASGRRNNQAAGRNDTTFYFGKIGFTTERISLYGKTSFAVDYFRSSDAIANGQKGTSYAFLATQKLNPIGAELFAAARIYELELAGGNNPDNIFIVYSGVRIKF